MTQLFSDFKKKHEYLICIDSDGCAIDSMDIKHHRCFGPCMIEEWNLQSHEEEILKRWNQVNLYSLTRGINRFQGLAKALTEVDQTYLPIEDVNALVHWVRETDELSNAALKKAITASRSICYTGINIPYGSMASAITDVPEERTALSTFRSIGATLAQLVIGVGGPMIIYMTDESGAQVIRNGGSIFPVVAAIFSVCPILCYVICYKCTTERIKIEPDPNAEKISLAKTFGTIFSNRALLGIVGAAIFLLLSSLLLSSVNTYLYADYFGNVKALSTYNMVTMICSLLMATITGVAVKKFGKKETAAIATIFAGIVFLVLGFLNVQNVWTFLTIAAVGFLGVNYFNLIIWANIIDVIDDLEVRTGKREDGTVYAVYSFARKIGQALAGGLGGYALGLIGYASSAKTQSAEVLSGLYKLATFVPGALFICVALMLIFVYPLSKKKVEENVAYLREKRDGR